MIRNTYRDNYDFDFRIYPHYLKLSKENIFDGVTIKTREHTFTLYAVEYGLLDFKESETLAKQVGGRLPSVYECKIIQEHLDEINCMMQDNGGYIIDRKYPVWCSDNPNTSICAVYYDFSVRYKLSTIPVCNKYEQCMCRCVMYEA